MVSSFLSQLGLMFWKQRVLLRTEWLSASTMVLLPAILMYLSSTNSGDTAPSNSDKARVCKVDNLLYCNYPLIVDLDEPFENYTESPEDSPTIQALLSAGEKVANDLGVDTGKEPFLWLNEEVGDLYKSGGFIIVDNETHAQVIFTGGENSVFPDMYVEKFNSYLKEEMSTHNESEILQLETEPNPYNYVNMNVFDLRIASFFLLFQSSAQSICQDRSEKMYFYLTRSGLRPLVYWIFQTIYYSFLGFLSVGVAVAVAEGTEKDISVKGYCISVWFHVVLGLFLGALCNDKKYVNLSTIFLLLVSFILPILFMFAFPKGDATDEGYKYLNMVPIYATIQDELNAEAIRVGCAISAAITILTAYLVPLLVVSDGMYAGCYRNYLYFLSPKFWTEGIVCLPPYDASDVQTSENSQDGLLHFQNVVRVFHYHEPILERIKNMIMCRSSLNEVTTKTIGPVNISLAVGKITTLLGKNGVGKSTMMRVAAGYFIPSEGEMILDKKNIFRDCPSSSLQSMSFCPQDNYLFDYLTVDEHLDIMVNLRCGSHEILSCKSKIDEHKKWILKTLNIQHKRDTLALNLSGGMKRRLCLAMATVGFPKVMMVDEASSGVDTINQRGVWKLLETCKRHSAILLTSHSALEAVVLSDSVINMASSTDISQSGRGTEGVGFSVQNPVDKNTDEYAVTHETLADIPEVIKQLPNDGSDWKVASRRMQSDVAVLPLTEARTKYFDLREQLTSERESVKQIVTENEASVEDGIPETMPSGTPSFWKQIIVLINITVLHPDRMFFVIVFAMPLNGLLIWVTTLNISNWENWLVATLVSFVPSGYFITLAIILSNAAAILAQEKELGVTKLLFSQGISRTAYLASYIAYYGLISFPIPLGTLLAVANLTGASAGSGIAIFVLFSSFWTLMLGVSLAMGLLFTARTAMIATFILPSAMSIYAQGSTVQSFANSYPGMNGQVLSGLLVNDLSDTEWGYFALSIIVNFAIGFAGFLIFVMRFENNDPIGSVREFLFCCKKTSIEPENQQTDDHDIEGSRSVVVDKNDMLLQGQNLVKIYGTGVKTSEMFRALDNVSFDVEPGSLLGLVGESGAGKSTLMDILSGQIGATSGKLFIEGRRVKPADVSSVVSLCGQVDNMWPDMPVVNAIKVFMRCRGYSSSAFTFMGIADPYVNYIIAQLGIDEFLKKPVKKLSGGQKRRLAFLVSLVGNTRVVLNDESMTGVDIQTRQVMWKILQDEVEIRNRSVVVTTHDIGEVEQYCNTVGILHAGKLVEMGQLKDIKKKFGDNIKAIFLMSSSSSLVDDVEKKIMETNSDHMTIESVDLDVLDESNNGISLVTFSIKLAGIETITSLIQTLESLDNSLVQYWSVQPQSLDDFVRAKGKPTGLVL